MHVAFASAVTAVCLLVAACGAASHAPSGAGNSPSATSTAAPAPAAQAPAPAPAAHAAASHGLIPITIGYGAPSAVYAPMMVAYQEGDFQRYGLKAARPKLLNPPADTAALISGEAQFVDVGTEVVKQDLAGTHLVYIASVIPYYPLDLVGTAAIHSVSDLKGKSVAATAPDTATAYAALTLLQHYHVSGVRLVYVHSVPAVVTAMKTGEAQAGMLSAPSLFTAESAGMHQIVDTQALRLPTVMIGVAVNRSWAQTHGSVINGFLEAYSAGLKTCLTNPAATEAALRTFLKISDPQTLARTYAWARASWPAIPLVHKAGIENLMSFVTGPAGKAANPSVFYDNSYLDNLQQSGFFRALYPNGQPQNVMTQ